MIGTHDPNHTNVHTGSEPDPLDEFYRLAGTGFLGFGLNLMGGERPAAKPEHVAADDAHILDVAQAG